MHNQFYFFRWRVVIVILFVLTLSATKASAQWVDDAIEFFTIHPNKKKAQADTTLYPAKIVMAPVVIYSPETKLGLGVGAKYLFKLRGSGDETRTSNMPMSVIYTLENQFIAYSGFEIFSNQEKWMLTGNLKYQIFPRFYYGVGRDTPESNEEEYTYNQVLIEPILLKRVFTRYLFLGGGLRYNRISSVAFEPNGLLETENYPGSRGSTSTGLELAMVYDSRDNLLNAHKGWYVEFTHGFYGEVLGGTNKFQLSRLDLRYYFEPFRDRRDVLAFQLVTHFGFNDIPLSELGAIGSEELYADIMKEGLLKRI